MSSTTHRLAAAALAAVVLTGPVASAQAASPAPPAGQSAKPTKPGPAKAPKGTKGPKESKGSKGSKGGSTTRDAARLAKDVAVKDAYLARVAASKRLLALPEDLATVVATHVAADRATLATLARSSDAGTARTAVAALRVENYAIVVELLEEAADAREYADEDPATAGLVQPALDAALAVTAASPRSALRAARQLLDAAQDALDESGDDVEDGTDDGVEDEPLD